MIKRYKKMTTLIISLVLCMASTITTWAMEETVHIHTNYCTDVDSGGGQIR